LKAPLAAYFELDASAAKVRDIYCKIKLITDWKFCTRPALLLKYSVILVMIKKFIFIFSTDFVYIADGIQKIMSVSQHFFLTCVHILTFAKVYRYLTPIVTDFKTHKYMKEILPCSTFK